MISRSANKMMSDGVVIKGVRNDYYEHMNTCPSCDRTFPIKVIHGRKPPEQPIRCNECGGPCLTCANG